MAVLKIEVSPGKAIPAVGEHFDTDDEGHIGVVVTSFPEIGDPNILVEVADAPKAYAALSATEDTVGDPRLQKGGWHPLWLRGSVDPEEAFGPEANVNFALQDTFEMSGITEEVRSAANYGAGVFACCVDTGVDADHEAFAGKDVHQWSRNGASAPDEHGHGTFVLSQLGGNYGILSDAPLGMFQALEGPEGRGSEQTVAGAIRAAADYIQALGLPIDRVSAIVSMSLGGGDSSVIRAATQYLLRLPNVKVYCAAGNDGPSASVGSPANTPPYNGNAVFVVGAADRNYRVATFSTGGAANQQISCYQFGVQIVGAARGTGNGRIEESGTSMATPYAAGLGGCHAGKGRTAAQVQNLMSVARQHQLAPPGSNGRGVVQLDRADFVGSPPPPPPPPPPGTGAFDKALQTFRDLLVGFRHGFESLSTEAQKLGANGSLMQAIKYLGDDINLVIQSFEGVVVEAGKIVPPPPPPPTVKAIGGVSFTYAQHDPARDCYLGYDDNQIQWGPHHGIPLIAPADGVVTLYTFPTPLSILEVEDEEYQATWHTLFDDQPCMIREADILGVDGEVHVLQTMYFLVYKPNSPIRTSRGTVVASWFGHVDGQQIKTGAVKKGEQFGRAWDSGIRFESGGVVNARAAHVHCCASATGNLTMNGDIDGLAAAEMMGWSVRHLGTGPGPNDYFLGKHTAGRHTSDFTAAGKPIPPMPS